MLGNIISQLYRIADLLKDKKLVDKDSSETSDFTTKPVYFYVDNTKLIGGILINEKYLNKNFTEGTTLKNIFPIVFNEIYELLQIKNDNSDNNSFDIFIENSSSIDKLITINSSGNQYQIYLEYNDKHYSCSSDSLENIGDTELTDNTTPTE